MRDSPIRDEGLSNCRISGMTAWWFSAICAFSGRKTHASKSASGLPLKLGMSPIARALHHRFDEVCRGELVRLRRKTAGLAPADREQVDAISAEITRAIAASVGAAVDGPGGADLGDIVSRLFAISPVDKPNAHSV
jgi:hypothetical protein